jgi:hypothetical protein
MDAHGSQNSPANWATATLLVGLMAVALAFGFSWVVHV